ncbi:chaoptin [Aplysia californica]|uniref:Chaoptin n=1 Tax=Aplysia californica TaxID=6500 RepID=A0ABM0JT46_APLCA|nr:chaoptin [Aplysia californica]
MSHTKALFVLMTLCWSLSPSLSTEPQYECPAPCKCVQEKRQGLGQVYTVRCSDLDLTQVPDLSSLEAVPLPKYVNLASNDILSVSNADFRPDLNIASLDLSQNKEVQIDADAFLSMATTLRQLLLEDVGLTFQKPLEMLEQLENLELLSLSNNNRKGYVPGAQDHVTARLLTGRVGRKLKQLRMAHCGIRSLASASLDSLTELEVIDLSNNWFTKVPDAVKRLRSLTDFHLSHCNIKELQDLELNNLKHVKNLDLSSNSIETIMIDAFRGTENSLKTLNLERCGLEEIPSLAIRNLEKLERLDLSQNSFKSAPANSFTGKYCLKTLLIGSVGLKFEARTFSGQKDCIEELTIKHMGLTAVPLNALKSLNQLANIVLDHNAISTLPKNAFSGIKAHIISLANNPLSHIEEGAFSGLPPNLNLNLRRTEISQIDFLTGYPEDAIKTVNLDYANIECRCSMQDSLNVTFVVEVYGTCRKGPRVVSLSSSRLPGMLEEACEEERAANWAWRAGGQGHFVCLSVIVTCLWALFPPWSLDVD